MRYALVQGFPVRDQKVKEQAPQLFPEIAFSFCRVLRLLEQPTTALPLLVNQESQHHQAGHDRRQILIAVAEVVFKVSSSHYDYLTVL